VAVDVDGNGLNPDGLPDEAAVAVVSPTDAEVGVAINPLSLSRHGSVTDREIVIDYGPHDPLDFRAAIRLLVKSLPTSPATNARRPRIPTLPTAAARAWSGRSAPARIGAIEREVPSILYAIRDLECIVRRTLPAAGGRRRRSIRCGRSAPRRPGRR
jgi:hypothetical protein